MITGAFNELAQLIADVRALGSDGFKTEVNRAVQEVVLKKVDEGFLKSQDPEGQSWEHLKVRKGMPLVDTGRLRNSWSRGVVNGSSAKIFSSAPYTATHQYGAKIQGPGVFPIMKSGFTSGTIAHSRNPEKAGRRDLAVWWVHYKEVNVPARQMVPESSIPSTWIEAFRRVIEPKVLERMHYGP